MLVCDGLLAVPVQASELTTIVDGSATLKAITNNVDINVALIANETSANTVVKIVSKKTEPLQHLVGLACAESSAPMVLGKVNVIKCVYMIS